MTQALEKAETPAAGSLQEQQSRDTTLLALGAINAMTAIAQTLNSNLIRGLQTIRDKGLYRALGYERFDFFLDLYEYSPMKYKKFNYIEKQFKAEGDEVFDLLNSLNVPMSTRKLIAESEAGAIVIEGDEIFIGDERADLSNLPVIKTLVKKLASANEKFHENKKVQDTKIERLEEQIETGTKEFEELRRAVDAQQEGTPYEQKLMKAHAALIALAIEAKKLPLTITQTRGRDDVESLWKLMLVVRHELQQDDFQLIDDLNTNGNSISKEAMQVLEQDGDFGDENEG